MRFFYFNAKLGEEENKNMLKKILILVILSLAFLYPAAPVLAHQPRFVREAAAVEVSNPEISQAFYGELDGGPAVYEIKSEKTFTFYVGLLVPDVGGIAKDVSAKITSRSESGETEMASLDGQKHKWTKFFEEFGGDNYWQGPEWKRGDTAPGTYIVTVSRPGNLGKYVLVVGERESFPPAEIVKTIWTLPQLKKDFFGKPAWTAFNNKAGLFLGGFVLVVAVFAAAAIIIVKKIRRRKYPGVPK